jgi:hypothetical protein
MVGSALKARCDDASYSMASLIPPLRTKRERATVPVHIPEGAPTIVSQPVKDEVDQHFGSCKEDMQQLPAQIPV